MLLLHRYFKEKNIHIYHIFREIFLLVSATLLGNFLVHSFHLPISGNILGFIIIIALVFFKITPETWYVNVSQNLIQHMSLFFIPIAAGVLILTTTLDGKEFAYYSIIALSTIFGIIASAVITHLLSKNTYQENIEEIQK